MLHKFPILFLLLGCLISGCYQNRNCEINNTILCGAEKTISSNGRSLFYADGYRFEGGEHKTNEESFKGHSSIKLQKGKEFGFLFRIKNLMPGQYVEVSVFRKSKIKKGVLVIASDGEQKTKIHLQQRTPLYFENEGWSKLVLNTTIPEDVNDISIYCYNPNEEPAYFDNIKITLHDSRPKYYKDELALKIHLSDSCLSILKQMRLNALERGIIARRQKKYISGHAVYLNDTIPIKLRFKGDWTDHLENDKWSFRIKVGDGYSINGLKSFSIQSPKTRSYLKEWVIHKLFDYENLLTTDYSFVPVMLNGENLGIYAIEEHFDKQLVESRKRREGPILKFDEEGFWEKNIFYKKTGNSFKVPFYESSVITPFKKNRTIGSNTLHSQFLVAQNLMKKYKEHNVGLETVFNPKQIALFLAICDLGGSWHGLRWHNQRFYYNPITSELEPIGFDLFGPDILPKRFSLTPFQTNQEDYLVYQLLNNTTIKDYYLEALNKLTATGYLDHFFQTIEKELKLFESQLANEYDGYKIDLHEFENKANNIKEALISYQSQNNSSLKYSYEKQTYKDRKAKDTYFKKSGIKAYKTSFSNGKTTIEIRNYHLAPVIIAGYSRTEAKDSIISFEKLIKIDRYENLAGKKVIEVTGNVRRLFFWPHNPFGSNLKTYKTNIINWPYPNTTNPKSELLSKNLLENSRYYKTYNDTVIFKGKHQVSSFIHIPAGYTVLFEAGTNLNFVNAAGLISYSPIIMAGTQKLPIKIHSSDKSMNGFTALRTSGVSSIQHTSFSNLNTLNYKGWFLTGGVTFYNSEVVIDNCVFEKNNCEDALNIINSKFSIKNSSISNTFSDGLDGDYSSGTIENCTFLNIGNDGVDFSGSNVKITNSKIAYTGDKGVSAGENTVLLIDSCTIKNSNIAIAAKDKSTIKISNSEIQNSEIGYAAYQKKDEFGPATINAIKNSHASIKQPKLIDNNSLISIDGEITKGDTKISIDSLYPQKIEERRD